MRWLHENGARFPKVQFPSSTPSGRGATALEDIASNEVMITIPFVLMLSEQHALQDPVIGSILQQQNFLQGDLLLAFYIMYELAKGISSFYSPYFNIIPIPSTITHWDSDILPLFQDITLITFVKFRLSDLRKMYQAIVSLCDEHHDLFPLESFTFESFKHAYGMIQNRAFGKRLPWSALVPLADCLNHSNVQTKYDYNIGENRLFRLYPSGSNHYSAGQEIFNSYGRRENANLLLDYGFAILDNEWETVLITVRVHQHEESYFEKAKLLQRLRLNVVMRFNLSRFNLPLDLITFYRILALSKNELAYVDEEYASINIRGLFSIESEIRAITLLIDSLTRLWRQYPSSLEDDETKLQNSESSSDFGLETQISIEQWQAILAYRVTQKRIISRTITKLKNIRGILSEILSEVSRNQLLAFF